MTRTFRTSSQHNFQQSVHLFLCGVYITSWIQGLRGGRTTLRGRQVLHQKVEKEENCATQKSKEQKRQKAKRAKRTKSKCSLYCSFLVSSRMRCEPDENQEMENFQAWQLDQVRLLLVRDVQLPSMISRMNLALLDSI